MNNVLFVADNNGFLFLGEGEEPVIDIIQMTPHVERAEMVGNPRTVRGRTPFFMAFIALFFRGGEYVGRGI